MNYLTDTSISLRFGLFSFFFLAVTLSGNAQTQLSLEQAIEQAIANNFGVQIARQGAEIAENSVHRSFAGGMPTATLALNGNGTYNRQENPASFLTVLDIYGVAVNPALNINYVLYNGGRIELTMDQLEMQADQRQLDAVLAMEQAVETVTNTYYQALVQQEQVGVTAELLALSRDRLRRQELQREYGQATRFDLLQTEDGYLADTTAYLTQIVNFENAIRTLYQAMGATSVPTDIELTTELKDVNLALSEEQLLNQLTANNTSLRQLFFDRELAILQRRIVETTLLPTVSTSLQLGYNWNTNIEGSGLLQDGNTIELGGVNGNSQNAILGVGVSYNLWDGGLRKRQIENAKLQEQVALLNTQNLKLQLETQLRNTFQLYSVQRQALNLAQERIGNARESLEISEIRRNEGQISSVDYRAIQLNFLNANQAYLNALFNLKSLEVSLQRLSGGLVQVK